MKRSPAPRRKTPLRPGRKKLARGKWRRSRADRQLRRLVQGRADGRCEANTPGCPSGTHPGGHAHHIRMKSQGGPDDLGNLMYVCAAGHRWIHTHPAESYERGWLRRAAA